MPDLVSKGQGRDFCGNFLVVVDEGDNSGVEGFPNLLAVLVILLPALADSSRRSCDETTQQWNTAPHKIG